MFFSGLRKAFCWPSKYRVFLAGDQEDPIVYLDESSEFHDTLDANRNSKSLSECYFAGKGTALVLPDADATAQLQQHVAVGSNVATAESGSGAALPCGAVGGGQASSAIQRHLQSMFYLLRPEETLKMAVKLESVHPVRTRYLVVVSRMGSRGEESCLLGIDCNEDTTVGLVLRVLADTKITLDGDGGFSVGVCGSHHIFKPVSVQAMWSALQTLHKVSAKAREGNFFQGGSTHAWVEHYETRVASDRSCLNEWHAMDCLESRRPPSPDSVRARPTERNETEKVIRSTLKEIMMSVDLDEVTSKFIRSRLEEQLDMDLGEFKSFIDQEMLVILGQMDAPTEIFDHVYLGSEWNASNYEELQRNEVRHILNVTREIDNFFPGTFDYLNVRVYDDEKTDLLKHWDDTFKYITKAKNEGSKVLVHCKMGISRSASVVIAYAMKAYNWDFNKALHHVKEKRTCIKPNTNFLAQLETYQGILDAMKNKEKLQRSKSETNLKSPTNNNKAEKAPKGREPTPVVPVLSKSYDLQSMLSGQDLRQIGTRPKSWSPDNLATREIKEGIKSSSGFMSLEDLSQKSASKESVQESKASLARHVLMPCDNGESYSVSPNQIVHLPGHDTTPSRPEDKKAGDLDTSDHSSCSVSSAKTAVTSETWDPGEKNLDEIVCDSRTDSVCDEKFSSVVASESNTPVWTSSAVIVAQCAVSSSGFINKVPESRCTKNTAQSDPFSNQLDRVFDKEEKKQQRRATIPIAGENSVATEENLKRDCPSRQSSWSSYDSAVAMGFSEKNELSRHSSWGSGDTRILPSRNSSWGSYDMRPRKSVYYSNENGEKILHSASDLEHSSSGIFPYDKEDIPWHPGTVKRTKQRLEGSNGRQLNQDQSVSSSATSLAKTPSSEGIPANLVQAVNETLIERAKTSGEEPTSAISETINIPKSELRAPKLSRLSASAPEPCSMELVVQECSLSRSASNVSSSSNATIQQGEIAAGKLDQWTSVKRQRSFLESLQKEATSFSKKTEDPLDTASSLGKVQNLTKEFEAKSSTTCLDQMSGRVDQADAGPKGSKNLVSSLPSSPVCVHQSKEQPQNMVNDDLKFKQIRSVFENKDDVKLRQNNGKSNRVNSRYSCCEVKNPRVVGLPLITNSNRAEKTERDCKRPPIVPAVKQIAATVIDRAVKKQQQYGKTHPLAKINIKSRQNNPLYNTM
ncbi:protein phosphatase Slingshot isoform X2 [Dendroctonus ponderosae]|uniref:protein phosphatase Slingshot isoform X2 n=1 Tax=Dendroctonus ponderosae TaxID=77166 RepID=UPI00203664AE|nr:protein phosphatase Slingshot isoform X2 [Dendroctonus ponderosae]